MSITSLLLVQGALLQQDPNEPSFKSDPDGEYYERNSLTKPFFAGDGISIPNWDFIGNAVVTDDYIRLTPDRQTKKGGLWNQRKFEGQSFEMTVQFNVNGQGKSLFGDGFALWYTKENNRLGTALGNAEQFTGMGIFFDTYDNHQEDHGHPWVSAIINDGTKVYDHDEDGKSHTEGGCQSFFRNQEHPTFVRISYWDDIKAINVQMDTAEDGGFSDCFTVYDVDLPPGYFFGASASTGDLADNHDIINIRVGTPGNAPKDVVSRALSEKLKKDKSIGSLAQAAQLAARHKVDPAMIVSNHHETHPANTHFVNLEKATQQAAGTSFFMIIVYVLLFVAVVVGIGYMVTKEDTKRFKY